MKRMTSAILAIAMLFVSITAFAETATEDAPGITFQGIPWKSDVDTVVHTLIENGYVSAEFVAEWYLWNESGFYLKPHDVLTIWVESDYEAVQSELSIPDWEIRKKIAGYEVEQIDFAFVNQNGLRELIAVGVRLNTSDFEAAYKDLHSKLTTLYGKGKNVYIASSMYLDIWYGENGTVLMQLNDNGRLALYYGILSAEEMLTESFADIPNDVDSSDMSGL